VAAIYRRKDSPWYWIRLKTVAGKWGARPTRFRKDNTLHRAKAQELAAQLSLGERTIKTDHSWVLGMIESHPVCASTRRHYINSWRHLSRFLDERGLSLEEFAPVHADQYIRWRLSIPRTNGKPVCRNMAVDDVKALKWIHRQGRLLGFVRTVAMLDYRAKKSPVAKRPVFTDEEIQKVRRFLATGTEHDPTKEWMQTCFEIAYATGCRLRETRLDLRLVDLFAGTITFPEPKGGAARAYTIPIPSTLRPLLERLKSAGRRYAFDWPGHGTRISRSWREVFDLCGLFKHTFHSLRATRVTNLRKAGIPQSVAMRLVNHSSTLVHELYQRHFVEDLRQHVDAGLLPASAQSPSGTRFRGTLGNPALAPSGEPCRTQSRTRPKSPACSSPD
jgi:integrase